MINPIGSASLHFGILLILGFAPVPVDRLLGAVPEPVDSTASSGGSHRPLDTLVADFGALFVDAWDLVQRPASWDRTDLLIAGGSIGVAGVVYGCDEPLQESVVGTDGTDGTRFFEVVDTFGENEVGLIVMGGFYLPGLIFDLPEVRRAGRYVAQTILYSAAIGALLKSMLGRARPFVGDGSTRFAGPWQTDNAWMSMPSGHTIVAFSIASSLSATFDRPWLTAILYTAASSTAIGRIYFEQHWPSDVLLATLISSAIGHGVVALAESSGSDQVSTFRFGPTLIATDNETVPALGLSIRF